jgi:hypothetical protein
LQAATIKGWDGKNFGKKPAVHIGEGRQAFVEALLTSFGLRVEDLEKFCELRAKVTAIFLSFLFHPFPKCLGGLKKPGIIGKETEQEANQQNFQGMICVARTLESVMEAAHALCGTDVDWILWPNGLTLITRDEAK